MKKVIGLVCEGTRDSDLLSKVIDKMLYDVDIAYRYIQPDTDLTSPHGNGWKGVWRWCEENGKLIDSFAMDMIPALDLLIVQMDGDVSRKERESHCACSDVKCDYREEMMAPNCMKYTECPVVLPCDKHGQPPEGYVEHLKQLLSDPFPERKKIPVIFVIPCDSTDTWIVAALEKIEDCELHKDPWRTIISRGKKYHGIRIHGEQKERGAYNRLIQLMIDNWDSVTEKCSQARNFQNELMDVKGAMCL